MKTKLTLNIDDKIIARAKKTSAKRNVSLSSVVEEYLNKYTSKKMPEEKIPQHSSLLERIRKYTHPVEISDEEIEKLREEHMKAKYGL